MNSEQQRQRDDGIEYTPARRHTAPPWSHLQLPVPNDRSRGSIISFVECVLVELTHADVGGEYRSSDVWGVKKSQYIAADAVGQTFTKRHYDERLGWHEQTLSRQDVRDELVTRLSRSTSVTVDTFRVKPTWQL